MTRSEKKKLAEEKRNKEKDEKIEFCFSIDRIMECCNDCEYCKKMIISRPEEALEYILVCNKKARKNIEVKHDEFTSEIERAKIGYYSYGMVNGKCDSLTFMRFQDEF